MKPRPRPNADFTVIAVPAEVFCTRLRPRRRVLADESVSMPPWTSAFARRTFRRIGVEATAGVQSHQDLRWMVPEILHQTNGIVAGVEDEKRWFTSSPYVLGKSMEKILDLCGGDFRCVLGRRQPASVHRCDPTVSGEAESSYPLVGPACDDGLSRRNACSDGSRNRVRDCTPPPGEARYSRPRHIPGDRLRWLR